MAGETALPLEPIDSVALGLVAVGLGCLIGVTNYRRRGNGQAMRCVESE